MPYALSSLTACSWPVIAVAEAATRAPECRLAAALTLCRAGARTCSKRVLARGFIMGPRTACKGDARQALGRGLPSAVHQLPRGVEVEGVAAAGVAPAGGRAGQLAVHADRLLFWRQARQAQPGKHLLGTRAVSAAAENTLVGSQRE